MKEGIKVKPEDFHLNPLLIDGNIANQSLPSSPESPTTPPTVRVYHAELVGGKVRVDLDRWRLRDAEAVR